MYDDYGVLNFFIGKWESQGHTGDNVAPDPDREVENTKFKQVMNFEPIPNVENHEQELRVLRYSTMAWEEGTDDEPFHEEVGYLIWDKDNGQMIKSFIVPRGIAVNAGGTICEDAKEFNLQAKAGSSTYGVCSNLFLNDEFKTTQYDISYTIIDENTFSYNENTQIQMKGRELIFDHTEKNILKRL